MLFANCHFHSTYSDDEYTPEQLVALGVKTGFKAMILTDHDTVSGTYRFQRAARLAGLLTMTGCEFNAKHNGHTIHIVGVDFNTENSEIREVLRRGTCRETERTEYLFEYALKAGTLRPGITWQEIRDANPDKDFICNNHVFRLLVERGIYKREEYTDFLMPNFSYRLPQSKEIMTELRAKYTSVAEEIIHAIRAAGGVPIVAHPHDQIEAADELVRLGVLGFETAHVLVNAECRAFFERYCEERGLYQLGGTDHGSIFGGCCPEEAHLPPSVGNVTEEHFMRLWRRERG